jgi:hypothetical protein
MATRKLQHIHLIGRPDTSGEAFFEPSSILRTNDVWNNDILRLGSAAAASPTVKHGVYGSFEVPEDYVNSAVIRFIWSSSLIANDVVLFFDYRTVAGNDANSLDQAGTEEALTVTDTAPGAAHRRMEATITPTAGNFVAGETVQFYLGRDGAAVGDTIVGPAYLENVLFEYSDV